MLDRKKILAGVISCFIVFIFSANLSYASAKSPKIAFINGTNKQNTFWNNYVYALTKAGKDLGMQCNVYYANENHIKMISIMNELVHSKNKPDVIIFFNLKNVAPTLIQIAESSKTRIFIINSGLATREKQAFGIPRQKYKYWIGEMEPDDFSAGYTLADYLFKDMPKNQKTHVLAFKGFAQDYAASDLRVLGLIKASKKYPNIVIDQIVPGFWDRSVAERKFLLLYKRYPKIKIVWGASDYMALGSMDAAKKLGLVPGKNIYSGGIDWVPEGLNAVAKGQEKISLGGHFMEGAWVAVVLYDYIKGIDFAKETVQLKTPMTALTAKNIGLYKSKLVHLDLSKINFRKYSKKYNPQIKKYNFDINNVLRQL